VYHKLDVIELRPNKFGPETFSEALCKELRHEIALRAVCRHLLVINNETLGNALRPTLGQGNGSLSFWGAGGPWSPETESNRQRNDDQCRITWLLPPLSSYACSLLIIGRGEWNSAHPDEQLGCGDD